MELLRDIRGIIGGALQKLANALKVRRAGTNHEARSDSFLAGDVFFKPRYSYAEDLLDETKYSNTIYDLNTSMNPSIHIAIMYNQCKDHTSKQTYDQKPLFYHGIAKKRAICL